MNRCGTGLGYDDHIAQGTEPCTPCRRAHADKRADYRRRRYLNGAPLLVDATGTRRRIQALAAIGWSLSQQSVRMGFEKSAAHGFTIRTVVLAVTADKVRSLYDELSMTPGPSKSAANRAAAKGWLPPLAYDDDTIDDPSASPARPTRDSAIDEVAIQRAMRGGDVNLSRAERAEAVQRLTTLGLSATQIAERLRVQPRSVTRIRTTGRRTA